MASTAAAIVANARRDVISHFMSADAVSETKAIAYQPGRNIRQRQFERLQKAGIIRTAQGDKYWIDVPRYDEWSRSRHRQVGLAMGAFAMIGAVAVMLAG